MTTRALLLRKWGDWDGIDYVMVGLDTALVRKLLGRMADVRRWRKQDDDLRSVDYAFGSIYAYDDSVLEELLTPGDLQALEDGEYILTEWQQPPGHSGYARTELDQVVVYPESVHFEFVPKHTEVVLVSTTLHGHELQAILEELKTIEEGSPSPLDLISEALEEEEC